MEWVVMEGRGPREEFASAARALQSTRLAPAPREVESPVVPKWTRRSVRARIEPCSAPRCCSWAPR